MIRLHGKTFMSRPGTDSLASSPVRTLALPGFPRLYRGPRLSRNPCCTSLFPLCTAKRNFFTGLHFRRRPIFPLPAPSAYSAVHLFVQINVQLRATNVNAKNSRKLFICYDLRKFPFENLKTNCADKFAHLAPDFATSPFRSFAVSP